MRVLIIIERWELSADGGHRWAVETVQGLAGRGHQLTILAARQGEGLAIPAEAALKIWPELFIGYARHLREFSAWATQERRAAQADVSLSLTSLAAGNILHTWQQPLAVLRSQRRGPKANPIKLLLDAMFYPGENHGRELLTRERATLSDVALKRVVAITPEIARQYEEQWPALHPRLRVIGPGVGPAQESAEERRRIRQRIRRGLDLPMDAGVMFFPATPLDQASARAVFEALRSALSRQAGLYLIAGGDLTYALQHLASQTGVRQWVRLVPTLGRLHHLYYAADFTIAPSRGHGCSRAVLESLCLGLPVIASADDGAAAWVGNNRGLPKAPGAGVELPEAVPGAGVGGGGWMRGGSPVGLAGIGRCHSGVG